MKIDKYLASKIAGSGFKLLEVGTGKVWDIAIISDLVVIIESGNNVTKIFHEQIGRQYKVISRTMDLTKPITVQGKEVVPLVELTGIAFPGYDLFPFMISNYNKNAYNKEGHSFYYSELAQSFFARFDDKPIGVNNQSDLFQWLEKYHFCYFLPDEMIHFDDEIYNN